MTSLTVEGFVCLSVSDCLCRVLVVLPHSIRSLRFCLPAIVPSAALLIEGIVPLFFLLSRVLLPLAAAAA